MKFSGKTVLKSILLLSLFSVILSYECSSFESIRHLHRFIRYRYHAQDDRYKLYTLRIMSNEERIRSTFEIVPGLAAADEEDAISMKAIDKKYYYVRQDENGRIVLDKFEKDSQQFAESATFWRRSANALPGRDHYCSFQSFRDPNMFIKEENFTLLMGSGDSIDFKRNSTFKVDEPNWEWND